jgi:hypothetical protein
VPSAMTDHNENVLFAATYASDQLCIDFFLLGMCSTYNLVLSHQFQFRAIIWLGSLSNLIACQQLSLPRSPAISPSLLIAISDTFPLSHSTIPVQLKFLQDKLKPDKRQHHPVFFSKKDFIRLFDSQNRIKVNKPQNHPVFLK